ncbi:MAG: tetratricopeptide repeat protein, partial [Burkholderiales bacterium]
HGRALRLLGQALLGRGERQEALATLRRAMALDPADAEAAFQTGLVLERLARLEEAIEYFALAAALAPRTARYRSAMGVAHFNLGEHNQAIADYRAALALDPGFQEARSNLLMALQHEDPCDHEGLLAEHVAWADAHARCAAMPRASFKNVRDPQRRLRIGYVSPRFCGGPLAHFFLPLLEAHDRDAVHVTCYSVGDVRDESAATMRALADEWRDAAAQDDDALVDRIRRDAIDILVDLVGHCPGQRLGVFARRGAPVQFTWLDYVGTTGVPAIDYVVTDALHTPVGGPQRFTERVLRLPDTRLCYRPPQPLPALSRPPAARRGYVTFGCFNRLAKLGPDVVATWSRILARVPDARLVLKATAFEAEETRAVVRRRFERHGIDSRRLDLRPYTAEAQMMREYADLDIALDPFPYNGCTTTCDALAMGVPVVTLTGSTLPGRHGVALLTASGFPGNIAPSRDEYVELAGRLAASVATTPSRAEVRDRFLASPVCDAPRFARSFERLYRDAWAAWCADGV